MRNAPGQPDRNIQERAEPGLSYNLALVTGASSGLGRALALELAKQKIPLILTGRNRDALEEIKKQVGVETTLHVCDLGNRKERQSLLAIIRERVPDLIINNAGFGFYGDVLTHTTQEELDMLEVNCHALLEISIESARSLIAQKRTGTILNIASSASYFNFPHFCTTAATKGFVRQFSQGFDAEVRSQGIRVLVSCPGQIQTDFRRRASRGLSPRPSSMSMPLDTAVKHIFYQLKKEKSVYIFNWRTRALIFLSRFFPESLIQFHLKKEIASRINRSN